MRRSCEWLNGCSSLTDDDKVIRLEHSVLIEGSEFTSTCLPVSVKTLYSTVCNVTWLVEYFERLNFYKNYNHISVTESYNKHIVRSFLIIYVFLFSKVQLSRSKIPYLNKSTKIIYVIINKSVNEMVNNKLSMKFQK